MHICPIFLLLGTVQVTLSSDDYVYGCETDRDCPPSAPDCGRSGRATMSICYNKHWRLVQSYRMSPSACLTDCPCPRGKTKNIRGYCVSIRSYEDEEDDEYDYDTTTSLTTSTATTTTILSAFHQHQRHQQSTKQDKQEKVIVHGRESPSSTASSTGCNIGSFSATAILLTMKYSL